MVASLQTDKGQRCSAIRLRRAYSSSPLMAYHVGSAPEWKKLVFSMLSSAMSSRMPITSLSRLRMKRVSSLSRHAGELIVLFVGGGNVPWNVDDLLTRGEKLVEVVDALLKFGQQFRFSRRSFLVLHSGEGSARLG